MRHNRAAGFFGIRVGWTLTNVSSSLVRVLTNVSLPHAVAASFTGFLGGGFQHPRALPHFQFWRQPVSVDVVVLIGEKATTLVVEALFNAGMAQHVLFGSRLAGHLPARTSPRIIRAETWSAAAEIVSGTGRCLIVAQKGFMPSEVSLTDHYARPITVIDAESLIVASVTRRPDRRMAI